MQRILVVRGSAIGDFVLTLPAIKLLRDAFRQAHVEILGYRHIVALAEHRFYANATRSIEYAPLARFFAKDAELAPDLADYFYSFDLVVSYLFDPDTVFEANIRRCGVEKFLACSPIATGAAHAAVELARPLEAIGLCLSSHAARLFPSAEDRDAARFFLDGAASPIVVLHPGSGSARKNWPITNWRALAEELVTSSEAGSLLIVGGEADEQHLAAMRECLSGKRVRFAESLPLPQLASVLEHCNVFVGHDSGVSHIAAAVGTPCVLLFGPTDPNVWAPANENVRVLSATSGELADLPLHSVRDAVRAALLARAGGYELMRIGIST